MPERRVPTRPPVLYDAQCALCGKWTKVVFPPDGTRPVYCKPCLKKIRQEKPKEEKRPAISLKTVVSTEPVPFSPSKKGIKKKPKRKQVNLKELKKALEESLKKIKE